MVAASHITSDSSGQLRLLFRVDGDEHIGMGHLFRCRALALAAREEGMKVFFALKHIHLCAEHILASENIPFCRMSVTESWERDARFIVGEVSSAFDAVICDIANQYAFSELSGVSAGLKAFRESTPIVMLDGMWDNALAPKVDVDVDLVVAPYFGLEDETRACEKKDEKTEYLLGPRYFIFEQEYRAASRLSRQIELQARKILISFGGADAKGTSMKVLKALAGIVNTECSVRIIVGPGFSDRLQKDIESLTDSVHHPCQVLSGETSLASHMLWCDLAITNSGLTKYELAVTGTPALQISYDEEHEIVNKPFLGTGAALHLGVHEKITVEELRSSIVNLMNNCEQRAMMSRKGKQALDAEGADRILVAIRNTISQGGRGGV